MEAGIEIRGQNIVWGIILFSDAIRADPKNEEAYYQRGIAYAEASMSEDAISDFTEVILLNPERADYWYRRGLAHLGLGRQLVRGEQYSAYDRAVDDFSRAIELNPNEPYYHFQRGEARGGSTEAWFGSEREAWAEQALADYSAAIHLDPRVADFVAERGSIYNYLDMAWEAIDDYTEAIRLDPQNYSNYDNRAHIYMFMSDEDFEDRHPNLERLGVPTKSNWEMAVADLTDAIGLAPDRKLANLYYWRGLSYSTWPKNLMALNSRQHTRASLRT